MVAGFWYNQDGLPLQYGTQKAIPDMGGDYLIYGETREIEQYIPLVNSQWGGPIGASQVVAAPPTSFTGTTYANSGIQSQTTLFPLAQFTPVTTVSSSQYTFSNSAVFVEQVEVDTLIAAAGGASITVGLAVTSPGTPTSSFAAVTDSTFSSNNNQFINGLITADMIVGSKIIFNGAGAQFINNTTGVATAITTGGTWVGKFVPLISNAITPLPTSAWLSTIATGTFTAGLLKVRIKYVMFGNINQ